MASKYERGANGRGSVPSAATRGTHSKRAIFRRTVFLMVVCGVLMFIPLGWKLWNIAIVHHEEYQNMATRQQTLDYEVAASRGNIYDRNGNVMAMSSTVYQLIVSPVDLEKSVPTKDGDGEPLDSEVRQAMLEAKRDQLAKDIAQLVPGLDVEWLEGQVRKVGSYYQVLKSNIEEEDAKTIRAYITENKAAAFLYLNPGTKRYYPYSGLAAQALGFVNANGGAYGIEAMYNDLLEGTVGRVVTSRRGGSGGEVYNPFATYVDAVQGYDVTLTLDATIQSYLEKAIEEGIKDYDVQNGAFAIAMNPKTGAILGIASSPDFDPNNYSQVTDDLLLKQIEEDIQTNYQKLKAANDQLPVGSEEKLTDEELMDKAKSQAYSSARDSQWWSKAVNDTYEPGSTFKAIVLASALEEGVVTESDSFYCNGAAHVAGETIRCSKRTGHGAEDLAGAVQNSCNPAFIEIGQRLGVEKFYEYFQAFGMTETSGVDLPGEVEGLNWGPNMSIVDLAVASFGQRFTISPIRMISSFAAVVNGGYLMEPYIVQSVTDQNGNVIQNTEPTVVRQVISEETSRRAAAILETVVNAPKGSGRFAYQAGYRIGGKTGSSETGDSTRTIVSFIGFAPADDPEVIVLLAFDKPQQSAPGSNYSTTGVYISGGNMSAVKAGPMLANILDYLGVEKEYTAEESAAVDVSTPRVTGETVAKAAETLAGKNLKYRTVGEGDTVKAQVPAAGSSIPGGSTVVLYLGDTAPEETGTVPDVTGLTYEAAKSRLENAGFFMRASGVSVYYGNTTTANSQSVAGGETAAIGTVINVGFFNVVEDGPAGIE